MCSERTVETYFTEAGGVYLIRFEDVVELAQSATNPRVSGRGAYRRGGGGLDLPLSQDAHLLRAWRGTCDNQTGGPAAWDLTAAPYQHSVGV